MSILGDNIRYLRWREGLSQRRLDVESRVGRGSVHRIENGEELKWAGKSRVARYFGYDLEVLEMVRLERMVEVDVKLAAGRMEEIEKELVRLGHCVGTSNRFNG